MPLEVDWMKVEVVCVLEEERLEAQLFGKEEEEMLGEDFCALGIHNKDMWAADEWEDEVVAMNMRWGNVEAVKMCGEAVSAAQMREDACRWDVKTDMGEAGDHEDEVDAVVICAGVDVGEEIGAVGIVEMH